VSEDTAAILGCWFDEVGEQGWWSKSDETDEAIRARFLALWNAWRSRTPESFLESGQDSLAGILLFDQFPRNMFRHSAEAFSTDPLALAIARGALDRRLDESMSPAQRQFLYMPFMHSEDIDDQQRSIALFTALGDANSLGFAHKHHDMIARFGRFPHRNAVLGRAMREGEAEAAEQGKDW